MLTSVQTVRDRLFDLLVYLDTSTTDDGEGMTPLERIIDYRRRLGDECALSRGYLYSIMTKDEIWEHLGSLLDALLSHAELIRKNNPGGEEEGT